MMRFLSWMLFACLVLMAAQPAQADSPSVPTYAADMQVTTEGAPVWDKTVDLPIGDPNFLVYRDRMLVAASRGWVDAMTPDGRLSWHVPVPDFVMSVDVAPRGEHVAVVTDREATIIIDARGRARRLSIRRGLIARFLNDATLLIGTEDGRLATVDVASGRYSMSVLVDRATLRRSLADGGARYFRVLQPCADGLFGNIQDTPGNGVAFLKSSRDGRLHVLSTYYESEWSRSWIFRGGFVISTRVTHPGSCEFDIGRLVRLDAHGLQTSTVVSGSMLSANPFCEHGDRFAFVWGPLDDTATYLELVAPATHQVRRYRLGTEERIYAMVMTPDGRLLVVHGVDKVRMSVLAW